MLQTIEAGIVPLRTCGDLYGRGYPVQVPWYPTYGQDHFETPLTAASFMTGASDYDTISDELYCPCGATLSWDDGNLGTAVEVAEQHIAETHPEVIRR